MWAQYIKEREDFEVVETERGVATYKIMGDECYIKDIFVPKEHRMSGEASKIADHITEVAKINGCKFISGTIVPSLNGSTGSLMSLLKYGFKLESCTNDLIYLKKEI
jgi:predicted GNAT family acetyltransferase